MLLPVYLSIALASATSLSSDFMHLLPLLGFAFSPLAIGLQVPLTVDRTSEHHAQVLILGGGMTGIIAARTLHQQGIHDFKIVEARDEIGGRMKSTLFGSPDRPYRLEVGANWIHGTQSGDGPANPVFELARKYNISLQANHYHSSMTTFDYTGQVNYLDVFNASVDAFNRLCIAGGGNIPRDATSRIGYSTIGTTPLTHQELAAEYYQFDWEYAQTPEMTSWAAAAWVKFFFSLGSHFGSCSEDLALASCSETKYGVAFSNATAYLLAHRQPISPSILTKAASRARTCFRLTSVALRAFYRLRPLSFSLMIKSYSTPS